MMSAETRAAVQARLAELATSNGGRLTPQMVVEDAKRAASPLHDHFEWDVKKAAYAHWIEQARTLITSVRVEVKTDATVVTAVAYVRDPQAGGQEAGYVAVEKLRTNRDLARDALVSEFGRVGDMLRRAREIAAALDAQGDVDEILERVVGLRQRFMEAPARQQ